MAKASAKAKAKATAKTRSKAAAKKAGPAAKKPGPAARKAGPAAKQQAGPAMKKTEPAAAAATERRGEGRTRSHLKPGDRAPAFALQGDDGQRYSLASMKGKRFILYFYPKDNTPGCTQQACDFRDRNAKLVRANVPVLGVSADGLASHAGFRKKYGLPFPLLSDPDKRVADAYGALGEKKLYGQTRIGIIRSTFVVGPDGTIEHVYSPVRVAGHADAVLAAVAAAD